MAEPLVRGNQYSVEIWIRRASHLDEEYIGTLGATNQASLRLLIDIIGSRFCIEERVRVSARFRDHFALDGAGCWCKPSGTLLPPNEGNFYPIEKDVRCGDIRV